MKNILKLSKDLLTTPVLFIEPYQQEETLLTDSLICTSIEHYAQKNNLKLSFTSQESPITFELANVAYVANVDSLLNQIGGTTPLSSIACRQIKS